MCVLLQNRCFMCIKVQSDTEFVRIHLSLQPGSKHISSGVYIKILTPFLNFMEALLCLKHIITVNFVSMKNSTKHAAHASASSGILEEKGIQPRRCDQKFTSCVTLTGCMIFFTSQVSVSLTCVFPIRRTTEGGIQQCVRRYRCVFMCTQVCI